MPFIFPLKVLNRESISIRRQCFYTVQVLIWNLCDNCITTCYIYCTAHSLENLIVIYWDQWVCWDVLVNSCTVEVENYGTVFVYRIAYRLLAVVTLYPTCGLYCMWMVVSFSWFMLIFTRFLKSVANINISVWKYLYIGIFIASIWFKSNFYFSGSEKVNVGDDDDENYFTVKLKFPLPFCKGKTVHIIYIWCIKSSVNVYIIKIGMMYTDGICHIGCSKM